MFLADFVERIYGWIIDIRGFDPKTLWSILSLLLGKIGFDQIDQLLIEFDRLSYLFSQLLLFVTENQIFYDCPLKGFHLLPRIVLFIHFVHNLFDLSKLFLYFRLQIIKNCLFFIPKQYILHRLPNLFQRSFIKQLPLILLCQQLFNLFLQKVNLFFRTFLFQFKKILHFLKINQQVFILFLEFSDRLLELRFLFLEIQSFIFQLVFELFNFIFFLVIFYFCKFLPKQFIGFQSLLIIQESCICQVFDFYQKFIFLSLKTRLIFAKFMCHLSQLLFKIIAHIVCQHFFPLGLIYDNIINFAHKLYQLINPKQSLLFTWYLNPTLLVKPIHLLDLLQIYPFLLLRMLKYCFPLINLPLFLSTLILQPLQLLNHQFLMLQTSTPFIPLRYIHLNHLLELFSFSGQLDLVQLLESVQLLLEKGYGYVFLLQDGFLFLEGFVDVLLSLGLEGREFTFQSMVFQLQGFYFLQQIRLSLA